MRIHVAYIHAHGMLNYSTHYFVSTWLLGGAAVSGTRGNHTPPLACTHTSCTWRGGMAANLKRTTPEGPHTPRHQRPPARRCATKVRRGDPGGPFVLPGSQRAANWGAG